MRLQFSHVRLLVSSFADCFRFYRDILGFEVTWSDEDGVYADFKTGGTTLALFDRQLMARVVGRTDYPREAESQDRVSLIFAVDDVDETHRTLRARGVEFVTMPQDRKAWGVRTAHFRDPDGNLIEINSPLKE